jgi:hypothetical protein
MHSSNPFTTNRHTQLIILHSSTPLFYEKIMTLNVHASAQQIKSLTHTVSVHY